MTRFLAILLAAFAFFSVEKVVQAAPAPDSFPGCVYQLSPPTLTDLNNSRLNCDNTGALKVAGSFTGSSASVGATGAAVPASADYVAGNKAGVLTGLTLDGSSNLNVNCVVGCAGGTSNNNADAVATSATNGQSIAWNYGFNGTTWDRLRVDGAKNLLVSNVPSATSGGTSLFTLTLQNTTNANNVKASAGQLYSISGFNMASATPVWVSLYNTAGTPTCGSSVIEQFLIPGNTGGSGFVYDFSSPEAFSTGIAFCATTGIAGTGAPAATNYVVNINYK